MENLRRDEDLKIENADNKKKTPKERYTNVI
jgi:hypothetical protein